MITIVGSVFLIVLFFTVGYKAALEQEDTIMDPRAREQQENEVAAAQRMRRQKENWMDEFFEGKDAQLWRAFKDTPLGEEKALLNIHHAVKSIGSLRQEVQTVMDTGKLAQAGLDLDTNQ